MASRYGWICPECGDPNVPSDEACGLCCYMKSTAMSAHVLEEAKNRRVNPVHINRFVFERSQYIIDKYLVINFTKNMEIPNDVLVLLFKWAFSQLSNR